MGTILNEIFQHFNELADKQDEIAREQPEVDMTQFDLIKLESAGVGFDEPVRFLDNSLIVTAEDSKETLQEKKYPFGFKTDDMVELAHPDTVAMADGPHTSAVVDNQNQQHAKIVNMVNKMPTGNIFHDLRLAEKVSALVVVANSLEDAGYSKQAKLIDEAVEALIDFKKKS